MSSRKLKQITAQSGDTELAPCIRRAHQHVITLGLNHGVHLELQ